MTRKIENERLGFARRATYEGSELGRYEFSIHGYENGYLTRVLGDDRAVFVTTDELTLHTFEELVAAVRGVLRETARD